MEGNVTFYILSAFLIILGIWGATNKPEKKDKTDKP